MTFQTGAGKFEPLVTRALFREDRTLVLSGLEARFDLQQTNREKLIARGYFDQRWPQGNYSRPARKDIHASLADFIPLGIAGALVGGFIGAQTKGPTLFEPGRGGTCRQSGPIYFARRRGLIL
jgi:hypothetical protein